MCAQSLVLSDFCDPVDYCLPGSSGQGIFQARILEWVAISYSRGSSWPRDWTQVSCISCIGRQILYRCVTWEAPWEQRLHCFVQYCTLCLYDSVWHIVAILKISVKWISKWIKNITVYYSTYTIITDDFKDNITPTIVSKIDFTYIYYNSRASLRASLKGSVVKNLPANAGAKSKAKVTQSCLTLWDPMDYQSTENSRTEYWSG